MELEREFPPLCEQILETRVVGQERKGTLWYLRSLEEQGAVEGRCLRPERGCLRFYKPVQPRAY